VFFDGKEGEGNSYIVCIHNSLYAYILIARTFLQSKDAGFFILRRLGSQVGYTIHQEKGVNQAFGSISKLIK
jgi:hypothetical protein